MASEFDTIGFENDLINLKDTQEGIQQMSSWCLQHRNHHKKIVSSWLNVLKKVRVDHRLILFYLANDVIQYSKRKNFEFVGSWGTALQKATTMVRDEKVRVRIDRIFKIWKEREIYSDEYISDLNGLLNMNPIKRRPNKLEENNEEFQTNGLITNLYECIRLSSETDKNFKKLCNPPNCEQENIKLVLKDKNLSEDMNNDVHTFACILKDYIKSLEIEILSRRRLINNIELADTFFTTQRGEVKVVVNAYKNFGARVKNVKKKLEDISSKLMSPIPSPDINAPSPEPDTDLILPDDSINTKLFAPNAGYISYMDGKLPFDINDFKTESLNNHQDETQTIQVINSRLKSDDTYEDNTFFKTLPHSVITTPMKHDEKYDVAANIYGNKSHEFDDSFYRPNPNSYANNSSAINSFCDLPLLPPPSLPSQLNLQMENYSLAWPRDNAWDTTKNYDNISIAQPPQFELDVLNVNRPEYNEDGAIQDHRSFLQTSLGNQTGPYGKPFATGKLIDVDHRNLISLTGSPASQSSNSQENSKNSDQIVLHGPFNLNENTETFSSNVDKDYRQQFREETPPFLDEGNKFDEVKINRFNTSKGEQAHLLNLNSFKSKYSHRYAQYKKNIGISQENDSNDNVEIIDMEMSDEDDQLKDEYTKNMMKDKPKIDNKLNIPDFHLAESSKLLNDSSEYSTPKNSDNYNPQEIRSFINSKAKHKQNSQFFPKSQSSQYFSRNFNAGPVRNVHFGCRRGGFQNRYWKPS